MTDWTQLNFESSFVDRLTGDHEGANRPRQVPDVMFSRVQPTPVRAPRLLAWSDALAAQLNLARPTADSESAIQVLAGNALAPGMKPYAARYGGHQFGHWAGQLGDGRAIGLGELRSASGERWELQLKGAGPTPYSRFADGRAVLRSSLREFVCSEAMHALGVPTTRALSLVATGDEVIRDMFYDGHPEAEPGAIVCRVAPSFIRFGNFEIHAALSEQARLRELVHYVIEQYYPEHFAYDPGKGAVGSPIMYANWFKEICSRTAHLIAHWMRVGFVHGVMNTDNMSILGLTIDYGPYGWLEGYDPQWTPNTTDAQGRRYAFGNQPQMGLWNLARLANALQSLVPDESLLQAGLEEYRSVFRLEYRRLLARKLGLIQLEEASDDAWLADLFELLAATETDYTLFFRQLAYADQDPEPLREALYREQDLDGELLTRWQAWLAARRQRCERQTPDVAERVAMMNRINPIYVPRNYLAQQVIESATRGDIEPLTRWLQVLSQPYEIQAGCEAYAAKRPEWARHKPGCSALSCSS
ncbi:MAG: protein adenylyltransferase SelO [Steroidobacteraceae bacterium]